ncbi:MAG: diguanylate cyclase [Acidobacteria bacterium]|nr:diguanylate cyclase [Acidobacteriota bacterium]
MEEKSYAPPSNFMDLLLDAVCVVSREGRFVFVSAAGRDIFGYAPEEMIGKPVIGFVHPEDRAKTLDAVSEIVGGRRMLHFENRYIRKDGTVANILWSARWSEADALRVAVARDITERKRSESKQTAMYAISEAANAAENLPALFQCIHGIVRSLLPADDFTVALLNPASDELTFAYRAHRRHSADREPSAELGLLVETVIRTGRSLPSSPSGECTPDRRNRLAVPLETPGGVIGALALQADAPDAYYSEDDKELLQFVSLQVAAAVERKRTHDRLQYLAQHDQLTDLPNRALFQDRLQGALARARRRQGRLALLLLDMDKFKDVNDTFGHITGDDLLREVAVRLKASIRASDTVGRLGGDEFVVLLEDVARAEDAAMVAGKLLEILSRGYDVHGRTLQIIPSIGIAIFPEDGENDEELFRSADSSMYAVKKGRSGESPD